MAVYWTTYGDVRGASGVRHKSRHAAERAVATDQRACARQGGYSDRRVVFSRNGRLFESDAPNAEPIWPSHGRSTGAARG
jgi:hypothetical protein